MSADWHLMPVFTSKVVRHPSLRYRQALPEGGVIPDATRAAAVIQPYLQSRDCEHLVALMLDGRHNFLGMAVCASGGIHGLHIAPRDVFKHAMLHCASAIILAHNHPSGDTTPSTEDKVFTQRISQLGTMLGCPLLDHLVVSSGITPGWRSIL